MSDNVFRIKTNYVPSKAPVAPSDIEATQLMVMELVEEVHELSQTIRRLMHLMKQREDKSNG